MEVSVYIYGQQNQKKIATKVKEEIKSQQLMTAESQSTQTSGCNETKAKKVQFRGIKSQVETSQLIQKEAMKFGKPSQLNYEKLSILNDDGKIAHKLLNNHVKEGEREYQKMLDKFKSHGEKVLTRCK